MFILFSSVNIIVSFICLNLFLGFCLHFSRLTVLKDIRNSLSSYINLIGFSLISIINNSCPRSDPWGRPHLTNFTFEWLDFIILYWVLFVSYKATHSLKCCSSCATSFVSELRITLFYIDFLKLQTLAVSYLSICSNAHCYIDLTNI